MPPCRLSPQPEVVSKVKSSEAHQNEIWLIALSILPGAIFLAKSRYFGVNTFFC